MSLFTGDDRRFILVRLAVVVGIVGILCLIAVVGMGVINDELGTDASSEEVTQDETVDPFAAADSMWVPRGGTELPEAVQSEGPESSWEVVPCTLFVSGTSEGVVDSLPMAPDTEGKPLETLLLVRRWAQESGVQDDYIEKVYAFNNLDTLYVDFAASFNVEGLKRTVESRFICYTRLFPLVAGNVMADRTDGVSLRGVPGVFR